MSVLDKLLAKLEGVYTFVTEEAPEGIDLFCDSVHKLEEAGREVAAYLRKLNKGNVVGTAAATPKIEALLEKTYASAAEFDAPKGEVVTAANPFLKGLLLKMLAALLEQLLNREDPAT